MEKVLYIYFKKSGMKMLGISTGQRIASLFGKSLYIKGHKVEDSSCGGQVRKLFISVNMQRVKQSLIFRSRLSQWSVSSGMLVSRVIQTDKGSKGIRGYPQLPVMDSSSS
jgi:hypothetical protein